MRTRPFSCGRRGLERHQQEGRDRRRGRPVRRLNHKWRGRRAGSGGLQTAPTLVSGETQSSPKAEDPDRNGGNLRRSGLAQSYAESSTSLQAAVVGARSSPADVMWTDLPGGGCFDCFYRPLFATEQL